MKIILKGNNEEYAVRDIVRLFLPGSVFEYVDALPENEDYILISAESTDEAYEYFAKFFFEGKLYSHSLKRNTYSKNYIKRVLYELLCDVFSIRPPWGILTGIRPSKKVIELWNEGHSKEEADKILKSDFLVSDKKINLAKETALTEDRIIKTIPKNSVSLYVGIPFCPSRCSYCSFISQSIEFSKSLVEPYIEALKKEFYATRKLLDKLGVTVDTLYIGGGTPTALDAKNLYVMLDSLKDAFDFSTLREFTVEAGRPDTIDEEKLKIIKAANAERISINPQTMNDKTLKIIGRRHTAEDMTEKFYLARKMGFNHINTDLIAGLPGEKEEDFSYTLSKIEDLSPDSITVHSLSLKKGAYLDRDYDCLSRNASKVANNMIDMAYDRITNMGLHPYYMYRQKNTAGNLENIGFCTPGKESLYNIFIMQEIQTIIALGSGGSTKMVEGDRIERCFNVKEVSEYIKRIDEMIERKFQLFDA